MPKHSKIELTMRTPYRTLFENFNGFKQLTVTTLSGNMAICNRSPPRIYLLPPGELKIFGLVAGPGNNTKSDSGLFMHSGGYLFVHK